MNIHIYMYILAQLIEAIWEVNFSCIIPGTKGTSSFNLFVYCQVDANEVHICSLSISTCFCVSWSSSAQDIINLIILST